VPRLREFRWDTWANHIADIWEGDAPHLIAVDTETTGVGFYDRPFAATVTWRRPNGELQSGYIDLESDEQGFRAELVRMMLEDTPAWVFHNSKFDLQKLQLIGALPDPTEHELHDTQTLYVLLDENGRKGLKHLAVNVLGVDDTIEVEIKSGPNKGKKKRVPKEEHKLAAVRRKLKLKKDDGYHLLPREVLIPYALKDTEFTLRLFETLMPQLEAVGDPRLLELYREFMELKLVLLDMEADGFKLDLDYLNEVTSEYGVRVMEGWDRVVNLTGNEDLNPQSPAQILEAFAKRGVKLESTAEAVLKTVDDELADALIEYRGAKKVHTTYLKALQNEHRDGIVHPNFREDGARTGRMSSGSGEGN